MLSSLAKGKQDVTSNSILQSQLPPWPPCPGEANRDQLTTQIPFKPERQRRQSTHATQFVECHEANGYNTRPDDETLREVSYSVQEPSRIGHVLGLLQAVVEIPPSKQLAVYVRGIGRPGFMGPDHGS